MIAMLVVYWSPAHIIRGGYLAWHGDGTIGTGGEEIEFLNRVPSTWDETRVLDAKIGEHLIVARRSGEAWFIGGITGDRPANCTNDLNFLKPGVKYKATIFKDDVSKQKSDWFPSKKSVDSLNSKASITLEMIASGGCAVIIEPF